ncbi:MAG: M16 family metallopeptidase [Candidatus Eisenbacteria bacterium]
MTARTILRVALAFAVVGVLATYGTTATAADAKSVTPRVLLPVGGDPTVSIKIAFRVGSQDDPAGKEGLAALTAQMMAEGATRKHTYPEINDLLYPMAAGYGVRVDKELTTFSGRVHKDNVDAYTALLLDAVQEPAFDDADFQRLKQRARDYIEKTLRYSSDEELGKQTLYGTVFAGTPYAHLNGGTVAGLDAITLDDVKRFYTERFTRDRVILAVGGGYAPPLVEHLASALATLPAGAPAAVAAPKPAPIQGRQVMLVKKPGQSTAISFGFPIDARRGQRDFYALWLANSWLGEHRNSASHLYQVIREARGMNYGDYSYIEIFPEGGFRTMPPTNVPRRLQLFEVWVRPVPNDQAHFALRAAMREVEKLASDGLTQKQFDLTRTFLSKYCLHFAETTSDRLGYALDDQIDGLTPPGDLATFRSIVPQLTLAEVNAAVKKYLKPADMVIAIVSENADQLADDLASGKPSPMTYTTPKPESVTEEDKEIQVYPLHLTRDHITVVPVDQMFAK